MTCLICAHCEAVQADKLPIDKAMCQVAAFCTLVAPDPDHGEIVSPAELFCPKHRAFIASRMPHIIKRLLQTRKVPDDITELN